MIKDLFFRKLNTGNGTFTEDGKTFYFSVCEQEGYNYRCKIWRAKYKKGKWSELLVLPPLIQLTLVEKFLTELII